MIVGLSANLQLFRHSAKSKRSGNRFPVDFLRHYAIKIDCTYINLLALKAIIIAQIETFLNILILIIFIMPKYVNIKSYSIKIRKTNCFFSDVPAGFILQASCQSDHRKKLRWLPLKELSLMKPKLLS